MYRQGCCILMWDLLDFYIVLRGIVCYIAEVASYESNSYEIIYMDGWPENAKTWTNQS